MSYTPNNVQVFEAAYSGAFSGIIASGRIQVSSTSSIYAILAIYAGAWAQSFDTAWGVTVPDDLQLDCIRGESEATWEARMPFPTNVQSTTFSTPGTYTPYVNAIIASIQAAEAYFAGQGIPIPASDNANIKYIAAPFVLANGLAATTTIIPFAATIIDCYVDVQVASPAFAGPPTLGVGYAASTEFLLDRTIVSPDVVGMYGSPLNFLWPVTGGGAAKVTIFNAGIGGTGILLIKYCIVSQT